MVKSTDLSWELACLDISCRIKRCFFSTKLSGTLSAGSSLAGIYIFLWLMVQGCLSHGTFFMQNGQWRVGALSATQRRQRIRIHVLVKWSFGKLFIRQMTKSHAYILPSLSTMRKKSLHKNKSQVWLMTRDQESFFKNPVNARTSFHTHILIILRVRPAST